VELGAATHHQALHGALFLPLAFVQPLHILPHVLPLPVHFTLIVSFGALDAQQNVQHGTSLAAARAAVIFFNNIWKKSFIFNVSHYVDNSAARHQNESIEISKPSSAYHRLRLFLGLYRSLCNPLTPTGPLYSVTRWDSLHYITSSRRLCRDYTLLA
jgi:hypothetical protein